MDSEIFIVTSSRQLNIRLIFPWSFSSLDCYPQKVQTKNNWRLPNKSEGCKLWTELWSVIYQDTWEALCRAL